MRIIRDADVLYRCGVSEKAALFPAGVSSPAGPAEGSCPRQLQPRPMISFSRANHHALPQLFLPLPTGTHRGECQDLVALFRCSPRPCPDGQCRPETDLGPLNVVCRRQTPDQGIKPSVSPLPQQKSNKIKGNKSNVSAAPGPSHARRDHRPTHGGHEMHAAHPPSTNFRR